MSHISDEWVMTHIPGLSTSIKIESCHTYQWVMSHTWMSHVSDKRVMSQMNESCHVYLGYQCQRRSSHVTHWMSHVTYKWVTSQMNESCHVYLSYRLQLQDSERVMSHTWMSYVTYEWVMSQMNESCHVYLSCQYRWRSSHVTHMNESCLR